MVKIREIYKKKPFIIGASIIVFLALVFIFRTNIVSVFATAPSSPSNLTIATRTTNSVSLSWVNHVAPGNIVFTEIHRGTNSSYANEVIYQDQGVNTSFTDNTSVDSNTSYYYKIRSCDVVAGTNQCSGYSSNATIVTVPSAPALAMTTVTNNSIKVTATKSGPNSISSYEYQWDTNPNFSTAGTPYSYSLNYYTIPTLSANTTYYIRSRIQNSSTPLLWSDYSTTLEVKTLLSTPATPTLGPVTANSIQVNWVNPTPEASVTGTIIQRSTSSSFPTGSTTFTFQNSGNGTSYTDTDLNVSTTYYYHVASCNGANFTNCTPYSSYRSATTNVLPPFLPTGVTATWDNETSIRLTWVGDTASPATATRYYIYKKNADGTYSSYITYVAHVAGTVNYSYTISSGLTFGQTYTYAVTSYKPGTGGESAKVDANSVALNILKETTDLHIYSSKLSRIQIKFTDTSRNETYWSIERKTDTSDWVEVGTVTVGMFDFGQGSYTDAACNLFQTSCTYRVRAVNVGPPVVYSAYSNETSVPKITTQGLTGSVTAAKNVQVNWPKPALTDSWHLYCEIERKTSFEGWKLITGNTIFAPDASTSAYSDKTTNYNESYTYRIRFYNSETKIYSDYSNEVTINNPAVPSNITEEGKLPLVSFDGRTVETVSSGNMVYTSDVERFAVIDASNPNNPLVKGSIDLIDRNDCQSSYLCHADSAVFSLAVKDNYVYGSYYVHNTDSDRYYALLTFDASDPTNPRIVNRVVTASQHVSLLVRENKLFASTGKGLMSYDLSPFPINPVAYGSRPSNQSSSNFFTVGDSLVIKDHFAYYVAEYNTLEVVDINSTSFGNTKELSLVSGYHYYRSIAIKDNTLYVRDVSSVRAIDITDPANPILGGVVDLPALPENSDDSAERPNYPMVVVGTNLITGTGGYYKGYNPLPSCGVQVIDISSPLTPALGSFKSYPMDYVRNLMVLGNGYLASAAKNLNILSVSDLSNISITSYLGGNAPVISSSAYPEGGGSTIKQRGDYLYVNTWSRNIGGGVYVYNIKNNPLKPEHVATIQSSHASDLVANTDIAENYFFWGDKIVIVYKRAVGDITTVISRYVAIYNIDSPTSYALENERLLPLSDGDDYVGNNLMTLSVDQLLVLDKVAKKLLSFNLSDTADPMLPTFAVTTPDTPTSLAVDGNLAFVGEKNANDYTASKIEVINLTGRNIVSTITDVATNGIFDYQSSIAIRNNLLYSLFSNSLKIYDLTNPALPILRGSLGRGGTAMSFDGDRLNLTTPGGGSTSSLDGIDLKVIDISNPAQPNIVDFWAKNHQDYSPYEFEGDSLVSGDYIYLYRSWEISILKKTKTKELSIKKTSDKKVAGPGDVVTITFWINNNSLNRLHDLKVTDPIMSKATYVANSTKVNDVVVTDADDTETNPSYKFKLDGNVPTWNFSFVPALVYPFHSSPSSDYSASSAIKLTYQMKINSDGPPPDPKEVIINQMTDVVRIANACKTYAGVNKVHLVRGSVFADDNPYPLNRSALFSGNAPICDTTGLTGSQLAEATGNYPALNTFSYYLGGDYTFPEDGIVIIEDVVANTEDATLKCTFSGCTGSNWY